jgi:hypothetical protein
MWWHTRRNQISSFDETDESIYRVHRQGRQFSRLLAAEVCALAVVMLDTLCSKVVWRVLATHSICQFPLHLPSHASPCAITFQLDSTKAENQQGHLSRTSRTNLPVQKIYTSTWKFTLLLVFKPSPCCNERLSSGYFPGVWVLKADVSEHCVGSIFNRW